MQVGAGRCRLPLPGAMLLVKHSPGVLARSAWLLLPAASSLATPLPRESLIPALWAQPGASSAAGDLHCFLLPLSGSKHQSRARKGAPGGPTQPRNCGVVVQGKDVVFSIIIQSMNLFNVPLWELPALGRSCVAGLGVGQRPAFIPVGLGGGGGCVLSPLAFETKPSSGKWIQCFYSCINIHFNSFQKLTRFFFLVRMS